jgi:collagen type III alpha
MFAVAVLLAVFKLGSSGAEPLFLRTLPAESVAQRLAEAEIPQPQAPLQTSPESLFEVPDASRMFGEMIGEASADAQPQPEPMPEEPPSGTSVPEELASEEPVPEEPATAIPQPDSLLTEERNGAEADEPDLEEEVGPRALAGGASAGPRARATSSAGDAPVFYRPQTGGAGSGASGAALGQDTSGGAVCGDLGDLPESSRAVFPLPDEYFNSYDDTWGAPRTQGGHEGTDLMSPTGTALFAITDGTLVPVSGANGNGWNTLGGYTVMLRADYDVGPIKQGDLFYYAHMDREGSLPIGTRVSAGQQVGTVGDTGQGPEVTRGQFPPHLHLGWYDTSGARTSLASGAMNPYTLLLWLEENGGAVRGGTDASYCTAPESAAPAPSTGGSSWPSGSYAGATPDLDTGEPDDARPSPIVEKTEHNHDHQGEGRADHDGQAGQGQSPAPQQDQTAQQDSTTQQHNQTQQQSHAGEAQADEEAAGGAPGGQAIGAGSNNGAESNVQQAPPDPAIGVGGAPATGAGGQALPDASELADDIIEDATADAADGVPQVLPQPGAQPRPEVGAGPEPATDAAPGTASGTAPGIAPGAGGGSAAQGGAAQTARPGGVNAGNLAEKIKKRVDSLLHGIANKANPDRRDPDRARAEARAEREKRAEERRERAQEQRERAQERREKKAAEGERQRAAQKRPSEGDAKAPTTQPDTGSLRTEQTAPSEAGDASSVPPVEPAGSKAPAAAAEPVEAPPVEPDPGAASAPATDAPEPAADAPEPAAAEPQYAPEGGESPLAGE